MPIFKMKKVWDYCTYNKSFFALIFALFFVLDCFMAYYIDSNSIWAFLIILLIDVVLCGYGFTITRDRINNGVRLPKIMIKDILVFGFESLIVFFVYFFVQGTILDWICSPLNFPTFDLEDMILELPQTIHLLFSHSPLDALTFVVLSCIIFYFTSFFMEIALARLVDTGSIKAAFNFLDIKRDIDVVGWKNYTKEYTLIVLAIVLFGALKYVVIPFLILNLIWDVLLDLLMFTTQFLGIGAIYSIIKEKNQISMTSMKINK